MCHLPFIEPDIVQLNTEAKERSSFSDVQKRLLLYMLFGGLCESLMEGDDVGNEDNR